MTFAEPIRVAMVVPHSGMSGAESNIEQLLRRMPHDRFELHVIAPAGQPLLRIAEEHGFISHEFKFPQFYSTSFESRGFRIFNPLATVADLLLVLQLSVRLARLIGQKQIKILYTGSMMAHLIGPLSRLWRPKTCVVIHMQDIIAPRMARGMGRLFFGLVARFADRVIVISKAVQKSLNFSRNVVMIYNGTDPDTFRCIKTSTLRAELSVPLEMPLIGVVGRLTPWKGHKTFLEAASILDHAGVESHFVVVGDDIDPVSGSSHYRAELEAYTDSLGLNGKVTFTGYRGDMPNVMRGLDILVVPSLRPEPFGLAGLEGMASEKPVIGSCTGGIAEVIVDNVTGRLFDPGNADQLAACIRQLIEAPALRAEYGQAGAKRVEQHFTLDSYVSAVADVFRQVSN